jgi:3',5'-cyclic AMP phosphodiesterase CpdA
MQVLHVTDLHFKPEQPFQKRLMKALLDDVGQRVAGGLAPDAIIFSGDLVQNPDDPDVFKRFADAFFHPLLSAARLGTRDVVFCPGNHDVSFKAVEEWKDEPAKLQGYLAGNGLDHYLRTGPALAYVRAISSGFYNFVSSVGQSWDEHLLNQVYNFPAHKFSFVALSTAFGCGTEGSSHDRGKLAVPMEHTLRAFQSVPSDHRRMSLMHHTLADLSEYSSRAFSPVVEKDAEGHFFGHIHLAKPSAVAAQALHAF